MTHSAFSRSKIIFAAIAADIAKGVSLMNARFNSGADQYRSRGKGKNRSKISPRFGRSSGNNYTFSSKKQNSRGRQINVLQRNGHVIMLTERRVGAEERKWHMQQVRTKSGIVLVPRSAVCEITDAQCKTMSKL